MTSPLDQHCALLETTPINTRLSIDSDANLKRLVVLSSLQGHQPVAHKMRLQKIAQL